MFFIEVRYDTVIFYKSLFFSFKHTKRREYNSNLKSNLIMNVFINKLLIYTYFIKVKIIIDVKRI